MPYAQEILTTTFNSYTYELEFWITVSKKSQTSLRCIILFETLLETSDDKGKNFMNYQNFKGGHKTNEVLILKAKPI